MILERIEGTRYSRILRGWAGGTAVVIGGGPSLKQEDVAEVGELRLHGQLAGVIAVNDAYLLAPWADINYFADSNWWRWHSQGTDKPKLGLNKDEVRERFAAFPGQKCTLDTTSRSITDPEVHVLRNMHGPMRTDGPGLSEDPTSLGTGTTSGFQSMNLSILAGAVKVILLGFDSVIRQDGVSHWHGGHIAPPRPDVYRSAAHHFHLVELAIKKLGVTVLNCCPTSEINCFPKPSFKEAFAWPT